LLPVPDNSLPAPEAEHTTRRLLCYVTDRNSLPTLRAGHPDLRVLDKIRGAIDAGVDWVQIREKDLPAGKLLTLVERAIQATQDRVRNNIGLATGSHFQRVQTKVIVNDRLDVALAASAGGVHLGKESVALGEVVRWCRGGNAPREFLIGASCHTLTEAREAEKAGVSYLIFGPIFDTPSKRAFGRPLGIAELSAVCAAARIPVLAIGGVDMRNARECFLAGAAGIAAIRMFQEAREANELKSAIDSLRDDSKNSATR
jgi:thiamine-phosphate pyrophosphorylase